MTFIRTSFFSFTIWVTAALINGALFAIIFSLGELISDDFAGSFALATIFSLVFSGPAAFCLWLVFLTHAGSERLSTKLLNVALVLSLFSCLFILLLPESVYGGHWLLLGFIIVLSSLLSVLLHHRIIKSFGNTRSDNSI